MNASHTEFEMCGYRFRFGACPSYGETVLSPLVNKLVLWRWNGYYWQIEIADCTDLDGAKYAMQFKIAEEKSSMKGTK